MGPRPPAIKQTHYDRRYVLRVVCPQTGQTVGMLAPDIDTAIINVFVKQFAQQLGPNVHAVLI